MTFLQSILFYFISPLISLLIFLIIVQVVFSLLVGFGVVNLRHPQVRQIYYLLERVVSPILAPIQKVLPVMGGFDFSPLVALIFLQWVQGWLLRSLYHMLG